MTKEIKQPLSVRLSPQSQRYLELTSNPETFSRGASINNIIEEMHDLVAASLPVLNDDEWKILLNVQCHPNIERIRTPIRLAQDIMDCYGALEPSELDKETAALVRKVYAMTQFEQYSIVKFFDVFWIYNKKHTPVELAELFRAGRL